MSSVASTYIKPLPTSVSVTLERQQDGAETNFEAPSKVSYLFHCTPKGGGYKVRVKCGEEEEIETEVFVPLPRRFMKDPAPSAVLSTEPDGPWRLATDAQRRLYFTEAGNTSNSFSIMGPGPGGERVKIQSRVQCERVVFVRGIAVDAGMDGTMIVYITGDHKLQRYEDGTLKGEIGGERPGREKNWLNDPNGICLHRGRVYVCDSGNYRVQVFSPDLSGAGTEVVGRNLKHSPTFVTTVLNHPEDLDFDSEGNMCVIDSGNRSIVVFHSSDAYKSVKQTISLANGPGAMRWPVSLRIFKDVGSTAYFCVSDHEGDCFKVFSMRGEFVRKVGISCTRAGSLRVLVEGDHSTISYDPPDLPPSTRPLGLAVDCDGRLYIACCDCKEIHVYE